MRRMEWSATKAQASGGDSVVDVTWKRGNGSEDDLVGLTFRIELERPL